MEIIYTLEPSDYRLYYRYLFTRQVPLYVQIGLPLALLVPGVYVLLTGGNPLVSPVPVTGLALIILLLLGRREALRAPVKQPVQPSSRTLRISPNGILQQSDAGCEETSWTSIVDVIRTKQHIYLFVTQQTAYVIPKRVFSTDTAADSFYTEAHRLWEENRKSQ